jgi:excisionase family DNA binding protein
MAQRFLNLDEAANQLGISKDRLNELREANKVNGYKDGASWKFRAEAIEKLAAEGIPKHDPPPSDLALTLDDLDDIQDDLDFAGEGPKAAAPSPPAKPSTLSDSDLELGLVDEEPEVAPAAAAASDLSLDHEEMIAGPASDISLEEVDEPTVAGIDEDESSDVLALDQDESIDITTDSILLSEAELGESTGRPPSTIIGKAELDLDADLDLSPLDKGSGMGSDVKLAQESGIASAGDDEFGLDIAGGSGNFEGLEELEVDLEAESSRILAPEDVVKAQAAAKAAASSKSAAISDLDLAPSDSNISITTSDIGIGREGASGTGLTGLSALELDDDDDQVLGDGSDVTLSGESSGINIISPSDSGLALDEVPLDLSGSAPIGSSLDLGMGSSIGEDDISLSSPAISSIGKDSKVGDFQLTPLGEEDAEDEKDSSQVIALDELSEEAGAPIGGELGDEGMLTEDFGVGLAPGAMPVGVVPASETPFSVWNVVGLAVCILLLSFCGMMTYDLLRNIWSWDGIASANSKLLDGLNPLLGR